jgi:signal transduction histidine kinase
VTVVVRAAGSAEVVVRDQGLGIPADEHGRVFERFHRLEGQGSRFWPGLGLGLSISRELAQLNEGSLRLERSSPGEGSTFVLRLPIAGAPRPC